jgi:hypothetical protein
MVDDVVTAISYAAADHGKVHGRDVRALEVKAHAIWQYFHDQNAEGCILPENAMGNLEVAINGINELRKRVNRE